MFGKVIATGINKIGAPFILIKGSDGTTYYCDSRGIKKGQIEDFNDEDHVNFSPLKDKNGKLKRNKKGQLSATSVKKVSDSTSPINFDQEKKNNSKPIKHDVSSDTLALYEEFEQLIKNEDYEGALCSKLIRTTSPDKLPFNYIEEAIWSAQKLLGIDDKLILSEFDKKLITIPIHFELPTIKKDSVLMKEGLEECFKNCDAKEFQKLFNALPNTNTTNATYLHLAIRFQTVCNKLYLPFYVLAAYTSRKPEVANEFLKFTANEAAFDCFIAFNKIIRNTYFRGQEVDSKYITKILAISLDNDRFDLYKDFCSEILGGIPAFVEWIDQEELQCKKIVEMLYPNNFFEKKVVEKYINFYIYKKLNDGKLNNRLLELLSEIAYRHSISDLDEILANNSYIGFNRSYKRDLLLVNFIKIVEYMKVNPKAYLLVCFVIDYFMGKDAALPEGYSETIRAFISDLANRVKTSPESLYEIYPFFKLDISGRNTIEEAFCRYLDANYPRCVSVEESLSVINEFNLNNCSFATVYFIENRENREELLLNRYISDAYLTALKCNKNYAKALRYVKSTDFSSVSEKTREIIRILAMNFKDFGVSPRAYEIFDGDFTIDVAETLALDNFMSTNGTPIILMSIYSKKNDLIKVLYLYSIYYDLTNTGNRTFYSELHKTDGRISGMNSHYKVIRMAFTWYDYDGLIAFLDWAAKITIDNRYIGRFEICRNEIDRLIKNPQEKRNWEAVISKLSKDNVRQINTPFGYAVQCMYLLQFYKLIGKKDIQTKEAYLEKRAAELHIDQLSRFAYFSKISETTNFISLNIKLIDILPETYILKFADFFERNSCFLAKNTEIDDNDIETLYVLLLNKYNNSNDEEYIELAINYYAAFSSRLNPHLDLYKNFCHSSNDKSVLFKTMFKLYSPDNAAAFHDFIYYNDWNCTHEEAEVLDVLKIVYSLEDDEIPTKLSKLTHRSLRCFKSDVAMMLQDYPKLTNYNTLMANDESLAYKYLVLQYATQIAFDQEAYWDASDKYWDVHNQEGVWDNLKSDHIDGIEAAFGYFKVSYAKQTKYVQTLGIEYVSRRYNNLFLIDLYTALINGQSVSSISDEYIIELMQENEHISLIYDKTYKVFKNLLNKLFNSNLSDNAKKTLIFSVIRGSICPIVDEEEVFDELLGRTDLHEKIKLLFEMTGYTSLAQSSLFLYINNKTELDILTFCKVTLPTTYNAIVAYNSLSNDDDRNKMRNFIDYACVEMNRKQFLVSVVGNKTGYYDESKYSTYKPVLANVIIATVFNYNIIRDFGNVVRQRKTVFSHEFFKDVLTQMGKEPVYWYLCAIQYALNDNRNKARSAFYRINEKSEIPELWGSEFDNLNKYINGELTKFKTLGIYNDFSAQKETAIEKTTLIEIATNSVSEYVTQTSARSALEVFTNSHSSSQEKLNAGAIILSFVKDDSLQFVDNISKSSNNESPDNLTYNEFIFEYGLLVVRSSRNTLTNKKFDVIIELFKFFELLNDRNKRKFQERLNNAFINLFTTIKSSDNLILYENWIEKSGEITEIIEKNKLHFEGYASFIDLLKKCISFEESEHTIMDKIRFLEALPVDISVAPIIRNLLNSVKKELERLKNGVMAKISINNIDIEDNSVFIVVENPKESKTSINLDPSEDFAKFFVNVYNKRLGGNPIELEIPCSGNTKNIRPGQISAERIFLSDDYVTNSWEDGDAVEIRIVLDINGEKVCDNNKTGITFTYRKATDNAGIMPARSFYNTNSEAFTPKHKGFGRTSDKEWLNNHIPIQNLSIIYGPSRVGKSSLLKYIKNDLAVNYKHKKGAFESSEKDIDTLYVISHEQKYHSMPEAEKDRLFYLFLEPIRETFKNIINSDMGDSDIDEDNIPEESMEWIMNILEKSEKDLSLDKKLKIVSKELSKNKAEIWVLIDEFQQVLEKWPITQSDLFKDFCKGLDESGDSIRYVICGADELVKLMLNRDNLFMFGDNKKPIGQFKEQEKEDYFNMLRDPAVWGDTESPFTDAALDYIFLCTGGNALYGKMIGNKILDAIRKGGFKKRQKIYPFDISSVFAEMLSNQKNNIDDSFKVNEFIENVTKNLETEEKYLMFIAWLMIEDTDRTSVRIGEIYDYFGALTYSEIKAEIDTALHLCSVRGILKWDEENGEPVYSFSTPFYFAQYEELVKDKGVPSRVEITDEHTDESDKAQIVNMYHALPPKDRDAVLGTIWREEDDANVKESFREDFFPPQTLIKTDGGDVVAGDKHQINAQTINNVFTTLISNVTAEERLAAFKELPKLESFYTESESKRMKELQTLRAVNFSEETGSYELFEENATVIEEINEINSNAQNRYYGTLVSTAIKRADEMPDSSVFTDPTDDELKRILGIRKTTQFAGLKLIPPKYFKQLCFAVSLHKMMLPTDDEQVDYTDVDFSPISIMYCKLIEVILKENHLKLYGKALPENTISNGKSFKQLNEPKTMKAKWKDITIGTFSWHLIVNDVKINQSEVNNNSCFEVTYKNGKKINKIQNLEKLSKYTGADIDEWKKHAMALAEVVEIRNSSAHGGNVISKAIFERLLKVLFTDDQGEIVRIFELSQNTK